MTFSAQTGRLIVTGQGALACLDKEKRQGASFPARQATMYTMAEKRRTYCDRCGHESGFTRFCPQCGEAGNDRSFAIPSMPRPGCCISCGEEYSTIASTYCSFCGTSRVLQPPSNSESYCCSCRKQLAYAPSGYCSHCGGRVLGR